MMTGFGFGFGGFVMMFFWIFVVAGIVWLVLAAGRQQVNPPASSDYGRGNATRILEERLARGEIDADEFKTRRAALEGGSR